MPTHGLRLRPRYWIVALATIMLAACQATETPTVTSVDARAQARAYQPVALWTWQENVITNASDEAAFFAFASAHDVNRVYIECEGTIQSNQPALIAFLRKADSYRLTTELLFGDDKWVLPGSGYPHQGYAVSLVSTYAAQLLSKMKKGQPVAVHFDVEPYGLAQWKTHRKALATDYVDLVTKLAKAAHAIGLKLSVDVPYWYSTIPVKRGTVTTPLNQLVIHAVDDYVIMDYWDTAARMERQATTDLTYANAIAGKAVVIGALTSCHEHPPQTSYCNSTRDSGMAYMEAQLANVASVEGANASFAGLAIEDYTGFRKLKP
ncbi:MAG TPA: hypothetical protein VFE16_01860 [Candidatus Cybelea sp.]|jgi:hypothetical protein|nr:hypothetical protein [Candidatus Cybelea sp.]